MFPLYFVAGTAHFLYSHPDIAVPILKAAKAVAPLASQAVKAGASHIWTPESGLAVNQQQFSGVERLKREEELLESQPLIRRWLHFVHGLPSEGKESCVRYL